MTRGEVGRAEGAEERKMFGDVKDVTDEWNSALNFYHSTSERDEAYAMEFTLLREEPITKSSTLVVVADAFSRGAAKENYDMDVFAVVLRKGGDAEAGMPVVQIVFTFPNAEWISSSEKLVKSISDEVAGVSLAKGIANVKILELSDNEARAMTVEGGLAPMFLLRDGKVAATKAAAAPAARQLLLGDLRKLSEATPALTLDSGAQAPVVEPPWEIPWVYIGAAALLGTVIWLGVRGQNAIDARRALAPNGRRRRRRLQ